MHSYSLGNLVDGIIEHGRVEGILVNLAVYAHLEYLNGVELFRDLLPEELRLEGIFGGCILEEAAVALRLLHSLLYRPQVLLPLPLLGVDLGDKGDKLCILSGG